MLFFPRDSSLQRYIGGLFCLYYGFCAHSVGNGEGVGGWEGGSRVEEGNNEGGGGGWGGGRGDGGGEEVAGGYGDDDDGADFHWWS